MTDITYFQTYAQRENHVTNNTLLMFRHLYRRSHSGLERLLRSVVDNEEIEVGPRFSQQARGPHSTPDAVIKQAPLEVYVEAKYDGPLQDDQLMAHLRSIESYKPEKGSAYLVGLSYERTAANRLPGTTKLSSELGIQFRATTYADLISNLKKACEGDTELEEILEDYHAFIAGVGLLPEQDRQMVALLCGTSWKENIETGVYYEPANRNPKWTRARIIGIYISKCITHVGRIRSASICRLASSGLEVVETEFGELGRSDQTRIERAIHEGREYFGDFAVDPHRFYVVDKFVETRFEKTSPGGMLGHRYFDLKEILASDVDAETKVSWIAEELKKHSFA